MTKASTPKKKSLPKREPGRSYTFMDIPDDVYEFWLGQQVKIKMSGEKKQFGIPSVVYKITRSHPDFPKDGK